MIFPTTPYDYRDIPWTDPNGIQWIARILSSGDAQWSRYAAPGTGGSTAWDDLTGVPAALTSAQAAATPSIRAIGTGATDAMAGNKTAGDLGGALATKFIAGVGALTGPSSPLTIGTAAANATGDFATSTQGATADNALPKAGGTVTGTITLDPLATIKLTSSFSADERWSGTTIGGTAGATITVGQLCYLSSEGTWELADANAAGTSGSVILGLCLLAATDGTATTMLLDGTMRSAAFSASLTVAAPLYVSAATVGAIALIAPSGTGDIIRIVGHVITAEPNTILFSPDNNWIELA